MLMTMMMMMMKEKSQFQRRSDRHDSSVKVSVVRMLQQLRACDVTLPSNGSRNDDANQ